MKDTKNHQGSTKRAPGRPKTKMGRPIEAIDAPNIENADDIWKLLSMALTAVAKGELSSQRGLALATLSRACIKSYELTNIEKRIEALEAQAGLEGE